VNSSSFVYLLCDLACPEPNAMSVCCLRDSMIQIAQTFLPVQHTYFVWNHTPSIMTRDKDGAKGHPIIQSPKSILCNRYILFRMTADSMAPSLPITALRYLMVILAWGQPYQPCQVSQEQTGGASVFVRYRVNRSICIDGHDLFVCSVAEANLILWLESTIMSNRAHLPAGDFETDSESREK
jgi:hypothetical protein